MQHEDGTDYDPKPDVMVLRQPLPRGSMASVRLDRVGAPLFIAEIASDSTKENDQGDKRAAYAANGVPEYLVFDPDGDLLSAPLLAWRLEGGVYVHWHPAADGWWHGQSLEVSFRAAHPYVEVRDDRDGVVLAPTGDVRRRARELERRMREEERERARLEQQLAEEARARAALEETIRRLSARSDEPNTPS